MSPGFVASGPESETRLEYLLRMAVMEPGRRPEFYRALLDANVWVSVDPATPGVSVPAGSEIQVVTWERSDGVHVLPFFTSPARMLDVEQGGLGAEMIARDLFESMPNSYMHLNPGCEYGRDFSPYEIKALLETGMIVEVPSEVLEASKSVRLDEVVNAPVDLLNALGVLYQRTPAVHAAFLVRMNDSEIDEKSTWVIAIEAKDSNEAIAQDTAIVVREIYRGSEVIDTMFISSSDGAIGQYMAEHLRPFYRRKE
jgi:hypothetical protein